MEWKASVCLLLLALVTAGCTGGGSPTVGTPTDNLSTTQTPTTTAQPRSTTEAGGADIDRLEGIGVSLRSVVEDEDATVVQGNVSVGDATVTVRQQGGTGQQQITLPTNWSRTVVANLNDGRMATPSEAVISSDYQERVNITLHFEEREVRVRAYAVGTLPHPVMVQVSDDGQQQTYYTEDEELLRAITQLRDRLVDTAEE